MFSFHLIIRSHIGFSLVRSSAWAHLWTRAYSLAGVTLVHLIARLLEGSLNCIFFSLLELSALRHHWDSRHLRCSSPSSLTMFIGRCILRARISVVADWERLFMELILKLVGMSISLDICFVMTTGIIWFGSISFESLSIAVWWSHVLWMLRLIEFLILMILKFLKRPQRSLTIWFRSLSQAIMTLALSRRDPIRIIHPGLIAVFWLGSVKTPRRAGSLRRSWRWKVSCILP